MTNKPETLGSYIKKILDVNKDGQITFKDFLGLFPNNAIAVAMLFVDMVVLVAEYRVWDVGMRITHDPYKALGFVLVSALPFYLGQMFWLYPRAVWFQKVISVVFVVGGLYTSAMFGLADLSQSYNVDNTVVMVIRLTVGYIAIALLYILLDPGIKAWRAKVTAHAAVELEKEFQELARSMLKEWQETKNLERETIDLFGDEEAVITQLNALRGKAPNKAYAQTVQTVVKQADNTPKNTGQQQSHWYSLDEWLQITKQPREAALQQWQNREYSQFAAYTSKTFEPRYISGKNMRKIYGELTGSNRQDFTNAPRSN